MSSFCFLKENLLIAGKGIYRLIKDPLSLSLLDQTEHNFGNCISLKPNQFVSCAGDKWINLWQFEEDKLKKIGTFEARKKITGLELLLIKEHEFLLFGDKFGDINSININTSLRGHEPKQIEGGIKEMEEDKEEEEDASEKEFDTSAPARFLMGHMDSIVQLFLNQEKTLLYTIDRMNKIKVSCFPEVHNLVQVILPFNKKFQAWICPLPGNRILAHSQMDCSIKVFKATSGELLQSLDTDQAPLSPIIASGSKMYIQTDDKYVIYGLDKDGNVNEKEKLERGAKSKEESKEKENEEEGEACLIEMGENEYVEIRREEEGLKLNKLRRDNS